MKLLFTKEEKERIVLYAVAYRRRDPSLGLQAATDQARKDVLRERNK